MALKSSNLEFKQKIRAKIYGFDNIEHQLGSNLNLILAKVFRPRKKFETAKPVTKDTKDRLYNIRNAQVY